jgi:hypothetical protein
MKAAILLICCSIGFILCSCTLPPTVTRPEAVPSSDKGAGRLLHLRVERWDTVRFSGLLGLREKAAGLDYVLLDATGVKLLEGEVAVDGSHNLLRVSGPLQKSDFAPFLAEALARIYLQEPDHLPCAGSWLYQLCREEGAENGRRKYGQAGPFTVWQVSIPVAGAEVEPVVYHQPWLGVRIMLEPVAAGK